MLETEKKEFIKLVFSQEKAFEKYILNVVNEKDRVEIMTILSQRIIRLLLREELNFLYMKDLENFNFALIRNILFKEISQEWLSYSREVFVYSQDKSLAILQEKSRVVFLVSFVRNYFKRYKYLFFQEIADSFIMLVHNMSSPNHANRLINDILSSDFVKNDNILVVLNYAQLWSRVRNASDFKKEQLSKIQIKIDEAKELETRKKYELQESTLSEKPLAYFDDAVMRLRNTMVAHMKERKT
jgi:hypothetical protein